MQRRPGLPGASCFGDPVGLPPASDRRIPPDHEFGCRPPLAHTLLINTIDMILISIHPFAFKKLFLLIVAFLCASSAFCFADSLFMTRHYARDQRRTTFDPFRPVDISGSQRVVSIPTNSEDGSRFSAHSTDESTSSRVAASPRICILNSRSSWLQGHSWTVDSAEESSISTVVDTAIFAF
ncbi:MAG: hypothetical protein V7609_1581 [Verrucomicrobiota bacterium]